MKSISAPNRFQAVARLLLPVVLSAWTLSAADFLFRLQSPEPAAGDSIRIDLIVINNSVDSLRRTFPESFSGSIRSGSEELPVQFQLEKAAGEKEVVIPSGQFAQRTYVSKQPEGIAGQSELVLSFSESPVFTLSLKSGESPAGMNPGKEQDLSMSLAMGMGMDRDTPEESYFKRHFFPYEPMYFIAGPDSPNAKFQISFKYRLLNTEADGGLHRAAPWLDGLHLAYSQRSLWDLSGDSAPFLDSSYMPEGLYSLPRLYDPDSGFVDRIGAQIGFKHESNGRDGTASRGLNIAYLRMPFVFGDEEGFHVNLEPRGWFYVVELSDGNPDLTDYRGYADLKLEAGWSRGVEVAAWGRMGKDFDKGSITVDASYPLHNFFSRSFSIYLHAQYFTGYGESLLLYNQRSETWRVGIGLFR